jgi:hypothetical protein
MLKLQSNLKLTQDPTVDLRASENATGQKPSFADHMIDATHSVAADGHAVESLSESSSDATELAVAMDQFLVELSALKALIDETRKAVDRVFQESRA